MVALVLLAASAYGGGRYSTVMPYAPPTDEPWPTCLVLPPGSTPTNLVVEDDVSSFTCTVTDQSRLCVTFMPGAPWPTRPTEVSCPVGGRKLTLVLVPGYDAFDTLDDGVTIAARGLRSPLAAFHTDLPDQDGVLDGGYCAVKHGFLLVSMTRPRKDAVCALAGGLQVPVRVAPVPDDHS